MNTLHAYAAALLFCFMPQVWPALRAVAGWLRNAGLRKSLRWGGLGSPPDFFGPTPLPTTAAKESSKPGSIRA